jgi:hypothetical protein
MTDERPGTFENWIREWPALHPKPPGHTKGPSFRECYEAGGDAREAAMRAPSPCGKPGHTMLDMEEAPAGPASPHAGFPTRYCTACSREKAVESAAIRKAAKAASCSGCEMGYPEAELMPDSKWWHRDSRGSSRGQCAKAAILALRTPGPCGKHPGVCMSLVHAHDDSTPFCLWCAELAEHDRKLLEPMERRNVVALFRRHETSYEQREDGWLWCCKCGEFQRAIPTWELCRDKTDIHWADELQAALQALSRPEQGGAAKGEKP